MSSQNKLKFLLISASCAVIAACSDASVTSPGEQNQVPPPPTGGGGGGGGGATTLNLLPAAGCTVGSADTRTVSGVEVTACFLPPNILSDATIPSDGVHFLSGPLFVGSDGGATPASGTTTQGEGPTLTIEAGATIVGESGNDYLVISRGAEINAVGTPTNPIVFTSAADLIQSRTGTPRDFVTTIRGEWGGLILNGRAPINACIDGDAVGGTADCQKAGEGSSGLFGGATPEDSSGSLQYVQVKYAGFRVNNEDELNGIAFQAVGSGTTLSHLHVHNNADDGIEFFGGTANAKFMILSGIADDNLDYTDGWTGNAQYILVQQFADDADQGFEFDSNGDDNAALPRSAPNISNFTLVGQPESSASDLGMLLREGTAGNIVNGIVVDFNDAGGDVDQDATFAEAEAGNLRVASVFFDNADNFNDDTDIDPDDPNTSREFDETAFFTGVGFPQNTNNVEGDNTLSANYFPGVTELNVPEFDVTTIDPSGFLDAVDYIGAFGPTETPVNNWATGWSFGIFDNAAICPAGTIDLPDSENINGQNVCRLQGVITGDVTLTGGNLYELLGPVFVGFDENSAEADTATLTIEPGVTVYGNSGADYLVVSRGSQIFSNGTAEAPVIMTSSADLADSRDPNTARGEWGGLVINGSAPINACIDGSAVGGSADCEKSGEGSSGLFGGADAADDSGSLSYTRVQFAGFRVNAEDELNGIAFQGTGSGTDVNFIQVHNNADDGIEFFGGTTNAKHLVLTGIADDSLDYTDGWTGKVQYVIVQHATDDADQGFEFDSNGDDNSALPRSNPTISNFTLIGQRASSTSDLGMLLREGTAGNLLNGIVVDFNDAGADIDQDATFDQADNGNLLVRSVFFDNPENFNTDTDIDPDDPNTSREFDEGAYFAGQDNIVEGTTTLTGFSFITDMSNNNAKGVVPAAGGAESMVTVIDPATIDEFFDSVDYIGAVEDASDTWYQGWTLTQE